MQIGGTARHGQQREDISKEMQDMIEDKRMAPPRSKGGTAEKLEGMPKEQEGAIDNEREATT